MGKKIRRRRKIETVSLQLRKEGVLGDEIEAAVSLGTYTAILLVQIMHICSVARKNT